MNETQKDILRLAEGVDINSLGIRELGRMLNVHPQVAKHHKEQLIKKGLLVRTGTYNASTPLRGILAGADLVSIPYLGAANCGPAVRIAGAEPAGAIYVSSNLLKTRELGSLFAVKADGESMNTALIDGQNIDDGDFVIIDSKKTPQKNECVLATIGDSATIKRYFPEYGHDGHLERITLLPDSNLKYDPIFIHPSDKQQGLIAGVVVQVLKQPKHT